MFFINQHNGSRCFRILLFDRMSSCACQRHARQQYREKFTTKTLKCQRLKCKTLIAPIYSHLRSSISRGEMRCVSKRLSRAKLPFPTSGERYARMMPPLSRWRTSENLPKNVTSVQRTVTEDFSEDWRANSALMPNAEDQRAPYSYVIRLIT